MGHTKKKQEHHFWVVATQTFFENVQPEILGFHDRKFDDHIFPGWVGSAMNQIWRLSAPVGKLWG